MMPGVSTRLDRWLPLVAWITASLILLWHYGPFFTEGYLGADYSYFYPYFLQNYYWYLNEGWQIPWFHPGHCAAIPYFPNPQSLYFSFPQLMFNLLGPDSGLVVNWMVFCTLGYLGFYYLLRSQFQLGIVVATLGALLFMLNTFFLSRMLVGHLTFQSYMLVPWLSLCLMTPPVTNGQSGVSGQIGSAGPKQMGSWITLAVHSTRGLRIIAAAMLITLCIHGGSGTILPQILASVLLIWSCQLKRFDGQFVFNALLAGAIAGLLSLNKLVAVSQFLAMFPRDFYELPGVESPVMLLVILFSGLFYPGLAGDYDGVISGSSFSLQAHEFDYGLGLAPLIILLVVLFLKLQTSVSVTRHYNRTKLIVLATLLLLPFVLNLHLSGWTDLLSETPVLSTSSNLFRWFCLYIPAVILLLTLMVSELKGAQLGRNLALGACVLVLFEALIPRDFADNRLYDPAVISSAWQESRSSGQVVPINRVEERLVRNRRLVFTGSGDVIVAGISPLICYEPIFGYQLEKFPGSLVQTGAVLDINGGAFNFHDPACMIFPTENGCAPGDSFGEDDKERLNALINYRAVSFNMSEIQMFANQITAVAWLITLTLILVLSAVLIRCSRNISRKSATLVTVDKQ